MGEHAPWSWQPRKEKKKESWYQLETVHPNKTLTWVQLIFSRPATYTIQPSTTPPAWSSYTCEKNNSNVPSANNSKRSNHFNYCLYYEIKELIRSVIGYFIGWTTIHEHPDTKWSINFIVSRLPKSLCKKKTQIPALEGLWQNRSLHPQ